MPFEVTLLLQVLAGAGVHQEEIGQYLRTFVWPTFLGGRAVDATKLFDKKVDLSKDKFKSSASEALSLYPVLNEFVKQLPPERATEEVVAARKVFELLCNVLDMLLLAANAGQVDPVNLQRAITLHFAGFINLHGRDVLPPKMHFAMHLPLALARLNFLPSCFVQERRHRQLKRHANHTCTGAHGVEQSLLEEVTLSHIIDLETYQGHDTEPGLEKCKAPSAEFSAAFCQAFGLWGAPPLRVSLKATLGAGKRSCARGDVVEVSDNSALGRICQVICFAKLHQKVYCMVSVWEDVDIKKGLCQPMENQVWIEAAHIRCCCIHHETAEGLCLVIPLRR